MSVGIFFETRRRQEQVITLLAQSGASARLHGVVHSKAKAAPKKRPVRVEISESGREDLNLRPPGAESDPSPAEVR